MKNVAIFGSSRAGKTTLAKMIAKRYPKYQFMVADIVIGTFERVLPQLEINHVGGKGMQEIFPKFLGSLFRRMIEEGKGEFGYVIDSCDITPAQAVKHFAADDIEMIFLATPRLTAEESLKLVREYETEEDWTLKRTDQQLLEQRAHWVQRSRDFEKECAELGIWFVDTSYNREEVLEEVLERLDLGGA